MFAATKGLLEASGRSRRVEIFEPVGPALQRLLIDRHPQEDIGPAGGADGAADRIDVGDDVAGDGDFDRRPLLQEPVLHVDDQMGGAGQVEGPEHVLGAAALGAGEGLGFGRDADGVHDLSLGFRAEEKRAPGPRTSGLKSWRFDRSGARMSDAAEH